MSPKTPTHLHESTHVHANGKKVKVPRNFTQPHLDALYHLKEDFGPHSHPDHELHGTYESRNHVHGDGRPLTATVRHLEVGITGGPEFEVEFSDGMKVTSIDEHSCIHSLAQRGFGELVPD